MSRLGIWLLRLLHALLPYPALGWLGDGLGRLLYHLAAARRRVGAINLRLCFPELDEAARTRLLKAHFRALGRATLQETVSWWGSRAEVERMTRLEGREHLEALHGRPVILLAPHFVGLNIGGVRFAAYCATGVSLYAPIKNAELDRLMLHSRTRFGHQELYARKDGIRPILRALRQGKPFYYLPDMDYGARESVFVPFFGVPAATLTALSRLARVSGAVVVPLVTRQVGGGYVARFYPAWEDFPSADPVADARRMNAFIEDRVREMPEQYFWLHQRFKTRPPGEGAKRSLYAGG